MPLAAPVTTATLPRYPGTVCLISTQEGVPRPGAWGPGAGTFSRGLARGGRAGNIEVLVQAGVVAPRRLRAADLLLRAERQAGLGELREVGIRDGRDGHLKDVELRALVGQHAEGHV